LNSKNLKFDDKGILITTDETLLFLAEKLCRKKGISSIVRSMEVTPPNNIYLNLMGGYSKVFEIMNNLIYEDSIYCMTIQELLNC